MSFAQDDDGNWGYKVGADAVVPFKSGMVLYDEIDYDSFPYVTTSNPPGYYSSYTFYAGGYYEDGDLVYVNVIFGINGNYGSNISDKWIFPAPAKDILLDNRFFVGTETKYKISDHPNLPTIDDYKDKTFSFSDNRNGVLTTEGKLKIPGNSYGKVIHWNFVYRKAT